jgi:hypothetical protein
VDGPANTDDELAYKTAHADYVEPILESGNDTSPWVGAAFNLSSKYGVAFRDDFFYADRNTGSVYGVQLTDSRGSAETTHLFGQGIPTPVVTLKFTSTGTLYIVTTDAILRVATYP